MSQLIKLNTEDCGSFLLLKLEGELSERTSPHFKKMLSEEVTEHGHTHVVIDFAECSYINSTGLGILHQYGKKLLNLGGRLGAINLNESIRDIIDTVADDSGLIKEYSSLDDAADDLSSES